MLPEEDPCTDQVTEVLELFPTVALNDCVCAVPTVITAGLTLTVTAGVPPPPPPPPEVLPPPPPQPLRTREDVMKKAIASFEVERKKSLIMRGPLLKRQCAVCARKFPKGTFPDLDASTRKTVTTVNSRSKGLLSASTLVVTFRRGGCGLISTIWFCCVFSSSASVLADGRIRASRALSRSGATYEQHPGCSQRSRRNSRVKRVRTYYQYVRCSH